MPDHFDSELFASPTFSKFSALGGPHIFCPAERPTQNRKQIFIERSEFGDATWWSVGGRIKGCVKGGLPLVLTLDASLDLQQVEVAAVNLL